MSKTTGSSVALAFRVDDDEVVSGGGGAGAENNKEGVYPSFSNYLIHPQVLPSFLTGSWTDPFGCVSIIEVSITSR